ncbi:SRPBCC family protein [Candidatus Parcubacteria bacterium]|nr:SRPBCC family protein [Candidatus Parcubacteria bacterium]
MQNIIKREVTVKADKEKVYNAIANPEKVVQWFPDEVEGKYAAGERPIFTFKGHGKAQIYVVDAKPYEYFSYRWIPGAHDFIGDVLAVPNTLVEFNIQEEKDGTCKVVMTESGFAALPSDTAENAFKQNSGGWEFMLGRLEKLF